MTLAIRLVALAQGKLGYTEFKRNKTIEKRVNKKCILSLRLPSKCSFTLSKLRYFGLRKPKTTSFYSLSWVMGSAKLLFSQTLFDK